MAFPGRWAVLRPLPVLPALPTLSALVALPLVAAWVAAWVAAPPLLLAQATSGSSSDVSAPAVRSAPRPAGLLVPAAIDARLLRGIPAADAPSGLLAHTGDPAGLPGADEAASPGRAFFYSALLPGAGQLVQGHRRWMIYVAAEALAWTLHVDRRRSGGDLRDRYRHLAREVALLVPDGPPAGADFDYYERLTKWSTSGAWDADPASPGLQPEMDPGTFNGTIWARARDLHLGPDAGSAGPGSPGWDAAVAYYRNNAYPPELLWDWRGNEDQQLRYGELLEASDDDFGEATTILGIILANHVLSAADAFVSARLAAVSDDRVSLRLRATPAPAGSEPRYLARTAGRSGAAGPPHPRLQLALEIRP